MCVFVTGSASILSGASPRLQPQVAHVLRRQVEPRQRLDRQLTLERTLRLRQPLTTQPLPRLERRITCTTGTCTSVIEMICCILAVLRHPSSTCM